MRHLVAVFVAIVLLLAVVPPLAAQETPLAEFLPQVSEVSEGIVVGDQGARSLEQITDTFADPVTAKDLLEAWGWTENAYRTFVPSGAVPRTVPSFEVSLHQFNSEEGAAQALPYIVDARKNALGLDEIPIDIPGRGGARDQRRGGRGRERQSMSAAAPCSAASPP